MSSFELSPAMFGLLAITLSQMHVGPFMLDACGTGTETEEGVEKF